MLIKTSKKKIEFLSLSKQMVLHDLINILTLLTSRVSNKQIKQK